MQQPITAVMLLSVEMILMKVKELDRLASVIGYIVIGNERNPLLNAGFDTSSSSNGDAVRCCGVASWHGICLSLSHRFGSSIHLAVTSSLSFHGCRNN